MELLVLGVGYETGELCEVSRASKEGNLLPGEGCSSIKSCLVVTGELRCCMQKVYIDYMNTAMGEADAGGFGLSYCHVLSRRLSTWIDVTLECL